MSKLFKLKKWLTLNEAASHISNIIGERVTLVDIYRLSLDEQLQISAHFINGAKAKKGKFVKTEDIKFLGQEMGTAFGDEFAKEYSLPVNGEIKVSEDRWVSLDSKVETITGVWDLGMVGSEALDIAHYHQQETSGVDISFNCLHGTFLKQGDVVCQLQSVFYGNKPDCRLTMQQLNEFVDCGKLTEEQRQELIDEGEYLDDFSLREELTLSYQPSASLNDHDCDLIIKTNEVTRFIQSLEDKPQEARPQEVKPMTSKQRTTLLVLFASMLKKANFDLNEKGITSKIRRATELNNTPISDETIRNILPHVRHAVELKQK